VLPRLTDCEAGLAESVKSADPLVTVTLAVPLVLPLVAVTVKGPPVAPPAVNKPDGVMLPAAASTVQVKLG